MSIHRRYSIAFMACVLLISPLIASAQDEERKPNSADLLEDFLHLVLIARPNLAVIAGEALLGAVKDEQELLDVLEGSPRREQVDKIIERATRFPTVRDTALKIKQQLRKARKGRARDPQRINKAIQMLNQGARKYEIGVQRLRDAGQFASKYMLKTLLDESERALHSYILRAMVEVGRDLVYPLCVALPDVKPRAQQQLAGVLMGIGYPRAVPYLKQVLENETTGNDVRIVTQKAYDDLVRTAALPADTTAAVWYEQQGDDFYQHGTRNLPIAGFDDFENQGVHWTYTKGGLGLFHKVVAPQIYADTRAMEMAEQALKLDKELTTAHTLWLIANLRRDIRKGEEDTPAGKDDYYRNPLPATVHIKIGGAERQHDALARAIKDLDPTVARRVIAALQVTLGSEGLIKEEGGPLILALAFRGDRRVAIEAAIALANARPTDAFEESFKVIAVLTEAFKQSATRYAVIVANTEERAGKLAGLAKDGLGYTTISTSEIGDAKVQTEVDATPGINLILIDAEEADLDAQVSAATGNPSLSAAPIVIVVGTKEARATVIRLFRDNRRVFTVLREEGEDDEILQQRIADGIKNYTGPPITEDQAAAYALEALSLLRDVALSEGKSIYKASDAQGALIAAMKDAREEVATGAADVLALLSSEEAQRAIADESLDTAKSTEVRVSLLNSLAQSIKTHGNFLLEPQVNDIGNLVAPEDAELMESAAAVMGALGVTSGPQAVEHIVNPKQEAPDSP